MNDLHNLRVSVERLAIAVASAPPCAIPLDELADCWEMLKRVATDRYGLKMSALHERAHNDREVRKANRTWRA